MAKTSGLNVRCYVAGFDISGDANALDNFGYNDQLQDITDLTLLATARQKDRTSAQITVNSFFNDATDRSHDALLVSGAIPTTDRNLLVALGSAIGDSGLMMVTKQASYNTGNPVGEAITTVAEFQSNDFGAQFGLMLTAHDDTHSSATQNASIDNAASSATGAVAMLQLFDLDSGTVTFVVQDSADDISFLAVTGLTFTAATARTSERLETASGATIRRHLRIASTGTFTNADFACAVKRDIAV